MGLLQRWLDEPDESIARFAKLFYVLTFLFMATFAVQMARMAMDPAKVTAFDFVGPLVSLFLTLMMFGLALDGRRSYKMLSQLRDRPRD
jgi:predicted transporter